MLTIEQYIQKSGLSRATVFNHLKEGKLPAIGKGKNRRILDVNNKTDFENPKIRKQIIRLQKAEYQRGILQAHIYYRDAGNRYTPETEEIKRVILQDVQKWQQLGIEIPGFSEKSLYRKIAKGEEAVNKKEHGCKGVYRNSVLSSNSSLEKFIELASFIYFKYKKPNIGNCVDLLLTYARNNEAYWELGAIPRSTALKALKKECYNRGWKEIHKYLNHYNEWKNGKARVDGAFTDDKNCMFMDWIVGDDHKSDISYVLVWNPVRKKFEKQILRGWHWLEIKTQKILGFILKAGELKTEDLIISLIQALKNAGKPRKGILIDNGLGRSGRFRDFCNKLNLVIKYAPPYDGKAKSPVERSFRYHKDELDNKQDNFVGSNHAKEGYHPTAALTPPETTITFDDYYKEFVSYAFGWYETRERDREINGKKIRISIRDLFNSYWKDFKKVEVPDEKIRYAWLFEKRVKYSNGCHIRLKNEIYHYMPAPLGFQFNNRHYICCYDPTDMNQIDLYATEDIYDYETGEILAEKNKRVATLTCTRKIGHNEHVEYITRHNKEYEKGIKLIANSIVDKASIADPAVLNPAINEQGRLMDGRKKAVKEVTKVLKADISKRQLVESAVKKATEPQELVPADTKIDKNDIEEFATLADKIINE